MCQCVFFRARGRHGGILFCWRRSTASPRSIYASGGVRLEARNGRAKFLFEFGRICDDALCSSVNDARRAQPASRLN